MPSTWQIYFAPREWTVNLFTHSTKQSSSFARLVNWRFKVVSLDMCSVYPRVFASLRHSWFTATMWLTKSLLSALTKVSPLLDYYTWCIFNIQHLNLAAMILSACPDGTNGLHLYPYDAGKYVRCSDGGKMSIQSCENQMAFSLSQRACRPSRLVSTEDRVRFREELQIQTTYSSQDIQIQQSPLKECPSVLRGNYPYPFHAGHFVNCQNGHLQIVSCPPTALYSLSQRECVVRQLLSPHDYLDYAYISVQLSSKTLHERPSNAYYVILPIRS